MAFNGSGTYSLYATGNPVVTGTVVSSTWANNTLNDIATALTLCVTKDGQSTPTGNLPMGTFKLTGMGDGSSSTDSMAFGQKAKYKVGATTYDLTTASGTQVISGLGFTPVAVIFLCAVTTTPCASWGFDDGTTACSINDIGTITGDSYQTLTTRSIGLYQAGPASQAAYITSLASGQFTLTWNKSGSPTGTASIMYLAIGL